MNPIALASLGTLAVAAVLYGIALIDVDWSAWVPATCMPASCFCEHLRDGFVRQPANTWSNLGFVFVGLLVAQPGPASSHHVGLRDDPAYRLSFAAMAASVGLGSWLYHASMTFVGQWFDVMAMYLLPTFVALYNAVRVGRLGVRGFLASWLALNAVLGGLLVVAPAARRYLFAVSIVGLLGSEFWARRTLGTAGGQLDRRWLAAAVAALTVAFGIWTADLRGWLCVPHSLWLGHAMWHLLCAGATWALFRYYASEKPGIAA